MTNTANPTSTTVSMPCRRCGTPVEVWIAIAPKIKSIACTDCQWEEGKSDRVRDIETRIDESVAEMRAAAKARTKVVKHPTRRNAYSVRKFDQIVGVVVRHGRAMWSAELAGGRYIAGGYNTRTDAVDAVIRNMGTTIYGEVAR